MESSKCRIDDVWCVLASELLDLFRREIAVVLNSFHLLAFSPGVHFSRSVLEPFTFRLIEEGFGRTLGLEREGVALVIEVAERGSDS
jgi:hypothetical protein